MLLSVLLVANAWITRIIVSLALLGCRLLTPMSRMVLVAATNATVLHSVILLMNLWRSKHNTRSDFLSLTVKLRVFQLVIRDLRRQGSLIARLIHGDLGNVRFLYNSWFLPLVYARVTANSLKSLGNLWRVSWWVQHLICHVYIRKRWRRLHLIRMWMQLLDLRRVPKIIFTIRPLTCHTSKFLRLCVLPVIWQMRQLRYILSNSDNMRTIACYRWLIKFRCKCILSVIDTRVSLNQRRHFLSLFHHMRLRHINMIDWLLSRIVKVMTEENIIVINCMVQLLFLKSLIILLITIMVDIVYLLTSIIIKRLIRLYLRAHYRIKWVSYYLRRTPLHPWVILINCSDWTFLNWQRLLKLLLLLMLLLLLLLLLLLHDTHLLLIRTTVHIEILMVHILHLLLMRPGLPHHLHVAAAITICHMTSELSVIAVHHGLLVLLLRLRLLLRLLSRIMTREINNLNGIVMLWERLLDVLRGKRTIFKRTRIRMRVKGQLIVLRWPNIMLTIVGSTRLVILAAKLLHWNGHVFRVSLIGDLVLVHKLMIGQHWRINLVVRGDRADLLNLRYIVLNLLKVRSLKLTILIEIRTLLAIAQHQRRYLFKVKILITCKRKDFITIVIVHYNEDFWVTISDNLLCLPE